MIETLFGGLLGGVFRLAPEVLKWLDRRGERSHEVAMMQAEMEFAKIRGEIMMRQTEAVMTVAELDAMTVALKEQGQTARAAGKFVAAISALVRPLVTYWFVVMYSAVKVVSMSMAIQQGSDWKDVIVNSWSDADMGMLMLVLTFWFVGRVWEREKR
jgi:hypothetical protein